MNEYILYALLLSAGLLHSLTHLFLKHTDDRLLTYAIVNLVSLIFAVPFALYTYKDVEINWYLLLLSTLLHQIHKGFVIAGYSVGDLSSVFPISRGLSPIFTIFGAWIFLNEALAGNQLYGVIIVLLCVIVLSLHTFFSINSSRTVLPIFYAAMTALITASYTIVDGIAARAFGHSIGFVAWLYIFDALVYSSIVLPIKRNKIIPFLKTQGLNSLISGLCAILSYGAVVVAMYHGSIGVAATLRETTIIFAAIIGSIFLKEPFGIIRIFVSTAMFVGIVVLVIGGI